MTAPTVVTSSNNQIELEIYACAAGTAVPDCANTLQGVASATITTTVPQFGLGLGVAVAIGLLGFVLIRQRVKPGFPQKVGTQV